MIDCTETDNMIKEAALEQDEIKWINFFKGHLSKKWATIQLKYYSSMYNNFPSITHWAKNVIIQIYNISFKIWTNRNKEAHNEFEERMNKCEAEKFTA